jgi:predicted transcriptional regulator
MSFKKLLEGFEIDRRSGYSVVDVVRVFKILSKRSMGRVLLVKELGLGEATIKTMIKNLRRHGFTRDSTRGEILTKRGEKVSDYLNSKVSKVFRVKIPSISKSPTIALIVRNASKKVKMGIEQRDEGMKVGANVTTLVFQKKEAKFPKTGEAVRGLENLEAERGGIAAALTLM